MWHVALWLCGFVLSSVSETNGEGAVSLVK